MSLNKIIDVESHINGKSLKQLQYALKLFEKSLAKWNASGNMKTSPKMFNEHIAYLKMKIAERTGQK